MTHIIETVLVLIWYLTYTHFRYLSLSLVLLFSFVMSGNRMYSAAQNSSLLSSTWLRLSVISLPKLTQDQFLMQKHVVMKHHTHSGYHDDVTTICVTGPFWGDSTGHMLLALCEGIPQVTCYWSFVRGIHRSHVTGPLWGESTGHWLVVSLTKGL